MTQSPDTSLYRRIVNGLLYGGCSNSPRDRHNVLRLNAWALTWAIAYLVSTWFLHGDYNLPTPLIAVIIIATTAAGIGMLRAYLVFLRDTDELVQRVQLNGLATGFGILILFGISYGLGESAGLPPVNINYAIAIGIFGYMLGVFVSQRRYR